MKTSELINLLIKYSDSWKHDGTGCFGFDIRHDGLDEIAQLYSAREEEYVRCEGTDPDAFYIDSHNSEGKYIGYLKKLTRPTVSEGERICTAPKNSHPCQSLGITDGCLDCVFLTPFSQQPSEEEIHKLVNKYLIIEESLCADDYPYFTMKGAKAIKELLNQKR